MLLTRNAAGDPARARAQLEQAISAARVLGGDAIEHDATVLLNQTHAAA
jgi:hypothetical protein